MLRRVRVPELDGHRVLPSPHTYLTPHTHRGVLGFVVRDLASWCSARKHARFGDKQRPCSFLSRVSCGNNIKKTAQPDYILFLSLIV